MHIQMTRKLKILSFGLILLMSYVLIIPTFHGHLVKFPVGERLALFLKESESSNTDQYPITFVSAFIDIGPVQKGGNVYRGKDVYYDWMKLYGRFNSPMVIYTNDPVFLLEATAIRVNYTSITRLIFIEDIYRLGGFRHLNATSIVFADPKYPKIFGVTTSAIYTCVMHSKYDFLERTIKNDYFGTPYIAWTDIGSLRNMGKTNEIFNVRVPPQFNDSRLAFNKIYDMERTQSLRQVMTSFSMWVAGGFFLGRPSVMTKFIHQYRTFVDKLMAMKLMSTDESILYAMYTDAGHTPDMIDIQLYHGKGDKCDYWFHLMYLITNHSCLGNNTI